MRNVLVLGAGQSATYLIRHLLERAGERGWFVTVGDRDPGLAHRAVGDHPRGDAVAFDVNDAELRAAQIERAAVVLNLLPQHFQSLVAWDCLAHGRPMISVSNMDRPMAELDADARRKGVLFLTEVGLDPGIDLMSSMAIIHRVHESGGTVDSFESYGSGVPAPEVEPNPLRYCITWNPRNVVMAGEHGAQYLEHGQLKIVPWHQLFHHSWPKTVPGFGVMEAYPNRDSLAYRDKFGIPDTETLVRGTLRYPGWSETWHQIVRLGLPNESIAIPHLHRRSFREIVEMFLPETISGSTVEWRLANHLGISHTGGIMENALLGRGHTEVEIYTQRPARRVRDRMFGCRHLQMRATDGGGMEAILADGTAVPLADRLAAADVIVNGALQDPERPLMYLGDEDVPRLKPGCLIVDVSCDLGMGFPFARPTSFEAPTFEVGRGSGLPGAGPPAVYYGVDPSPSYLWDAATWEISEGLLPYLPAVMEGPAGWERTPTLARAIEIRDGVVENPTILSFQGREEAYPHRPT